MNDELVVNVVVDRVQYKAALDKGEVQIYMSHGVGSQWIGKGRWTPQGISDCSAQIDEDVYSALDALIRQHLLGQIGMPSLVELAERADLLLGRADEEEEIDTGEAIALLEELVRTVLGRT